MFLTSKFSAVYQDERVSIRRAIQAWRIPSNDAPLQATAVRAEVDRVREYILLKYPGSSAAIAALHIQDASGGNASGTAESAIQQTPIQQAVIQQTPVQQPVIQQTPTEQTPNEQPVILQTPLQEPIMQPMPMGSPVIQQTADQQTAFLSHSTALFAVWRSPSPVIRPGAEDLTLPRLRVGEINPHLDWHNELHRIVADRRWSFVPFHYSMEFSIEEANHVLEAASAVAIEATSDQNAPPLLVQLILMDDPRPEDLRHMPMAHPTFGVRRKHLFGLTEEDFERMAASFLQHRWMQFGNFRSYNKLMKDLHSLRMDLLHGTDHSQKFVVDDALHWFALVMERAVFDIVLQNPNVFKVLWCGIPTEDRIGAIAHLDGACLCRQIKDIGLVGNLLEGKMLWATFVFQLNFFCQLF